jgi:hypothetical protein
LFLANSCQRFAFCCQQPENANPRSKEKDGLRDTRGHAWHTSAIEHRIKSEVRRADLDQAADGFATSRHSAAWPVAKAIMKEARRLKRPYVAFPPMFGSMFLLGGYLLLRPRLR